MTKCEICKEKIGETFLNKVLGTYIKDAKGKKHLICGDCQHKFPTKDKVLEQIK